MTTFYFFVRFELQNLGMILKSNVHAIWVINEQRSLSSCMNVYLASSEAHKSSTFVIWDIFMLYRFFCTPQWASFKVLFWWSNIKKSFFKVMSIFRHPLENIFLCTHAWDFYFHISSLVSRASYYFLLLNIRIWFQYIF